MKVAQFCTLTADLAGYLDYSDRPDTTRFMNVVWHSLKPIQVKFI